MQGKKHCETQCEQRTSVKGRVVPPVVTGVKGDADKPQWSLLPIGPITAVVKVLTFGAKKYSPNNWVHVKDKKDRYYSAALRHITAWFGGEIKDPESGHHHLAHAVCCLLFLIWVDQRRNND